MWSNSIEDIALHRGVHTNTNADLQWSEPSRLISSVQRGTQPGLKQKSQAIYQAADADSLNSLAQKLLQTRPLLQKKIAQLDLWLEFWLVLLVSYPLPFSIFSSFFIFSVSSVFCSILWNVSEKKQCWSLCWDYLDNDISILEVNHQTIIFPPLFMFILKIFRGLISLASIKETK